MVKANNTYTSRIEYDPELQEYVVHIPRVLLEELDWSPGSTFDYTVENIGKIVITGLQVAKKPEL